ncbi:MAG: KilA-N domain-containing protein [Cyanobacteria bacterium P01_F01_bin.86]
MSEIVRHEYNGFFISQRKSDGYVCLTDMAKASGKKVAQYFILKSTKDYLDGLSADVGIPTSGLIEVFKGGNQANEQGTWAHFEIAIDFAKWCNVPFRIWANRALRLLIEKKEIQVEVEAQAQPLQLPPADVRLKECANTFRELQELVGIDFTNPRVQQHYQDVINNIVLDGQKQLPPSKERWMGIVEFAEKLGYKVTPKQAPTLGKRAKAWFVTETGELPAEEDRLVNGRMCPVKLYNVTEYGEGLSQVVRDYLGEIGGKAAA